MRKILFMRFFLKFKWIFLIIGFRMAGGKGAFIGFLLGAFIDSLISPPTIKFRIYTNYSDAGQQQWGRGAANPYAYVDTRLSDAYHTLEINENATDDEVRQAYRRLALKYHPDRLASLGEEARMKGEKRIQLINQAKEIIFKARGIK